VAVTEASRAIRRRRSAASALALGAVLLLTAGTFAVTSGTTADVLPFVPVQLACVAVGALIVARRSHNLVGTLFLLFGLLGSVALVTTALAETTIAPEWAGWWSMIWVELALPLLMLAMQAFPAGRPMPGIWTGIFWATLAVGLLGCLITGL